MSEIDWELIEDILQKVQKALMTIEKRFRQVPDVEFFRTEEGQERLDGICMLFEAIGESFKNIDNYSKKLFLSRYPEIDWKNIIGFRNIIAHNYFDIDDEAVFDNCRNHLPPLLETVERMINDLQRET
jgi:uncharacterized protein with HEPN domain